MKLAKLDSCATSAPSFEIESQFLGSVAGVDEAGCGPWAGPVVAAAAIVDRAKVDCGLLSFVNDSKKLTAKKRETLFDQLTVAEGIIFAVGISEVFEIDQLGIGNANRLAMGRAVEGLRKNTHIDHLLIDGIRNPNLNLPTLMVVRGDQKSFSIAIASIIAKVTRDKIMATLHQDYPAFGWGKNAGYGTKSHIMALSQHGVTPHHRKSFAPIKKLIETSKCD